MMAMELVQGKAGTSGDDVEISMVTGKGHLTNSTNGAEDFKNSGWICSQKNDDFCLGLQEVFVINTSG